MYKCDQPRVHSVKGIVQRILFSYVLCNGEESLHRYSLLCSSSLHSQRAPITILELLVCYRVNLSLNSCSREEQLAIVAGRHGSTALLLFVLVAVSAGLQCAAATPCRKVDHDALVAFKKGIKSDPLGLIEKWGNASTDCCSWSRLACYSAGHVVTVDLRQEDAIATIPSTWKVEKC